MKKLFLTLCAGAMINLAAMAQVQEDTTATDNNNLTDMQQSQEDIERGKEDAQDSVQQGVERTSGGIQQGVQETTEETNNALERNADKTETDVKEGVESTENAIKDEANKVGDAAKEAADDTKDAVEEGAQKTGEAVEEGVKRTDDAIDNASPADSDNKEPRMETTTVEPAPAPMPGSGPAIEVVESKEGPMNEVVYKYNGEMFYVDRANSSIVKVEDGDLNDVGENKIVHKKEKSKR